ncbi:hypothetical protein KC19_VG104400 [Ceratodon purpureus]|uniref:DUF632 domain-containing protein n=1 Tax=Ceratodon purpureus TaxID=3225 RepID=A0A8T0HP20_CERPU|nr:hypothetical protein KC19_VG104400 [Ceratodon purpureus]
MGCSNSKVDNEEGVARCKQRKKLMKQTVTFRHNFAASHAQYVMSLKGIGSAFRQFAEGEVKDGETYHSMYPDTPTTPRTPTLSLGPPPSMLPPPPPMSSGFSPSPPHSPPTTKLSALRLQRGSPNTRAASSPESVSLDFLPPPPPPVIVKQQYRMEHTPPTIPTKIYRFEDSSHMSKSYRMEDSPAPPPLIQPVQIDDDWRYSGQTPPLSHAARESNPPPPPPVTRSSWQDLFMDPFRPSPPTFNYMEQRRNQEGEVRRSQETDEQRRRQEAEEKKVQEAEQKRKHEDEQRRIHEEQRKAHEMEKRRARELEQRSAQETEQRQQSREKSPERPPPAKPQEAKHKDSDHDIPELEDIEDVPDLEDVDEDIDGPPPKDSDDEKDNKNAKQPEPETPPKTPPQKAQEETPKAAKSAKKTPTPGKPGGKPPKPEHREEVIVKTNKELAVIKTEKGGRDLLDVLKEVDDCFMKAAESGENVSRMLETKKAHYHSSFSDSLRVVGESARMNFWKKSGTSGSPGRNHYRSGSHMSVVTEESASIMSMRTTSNMNMSMRSLSNMTSQRWSEECGLTGSHASTLDRLFAWEKKLYLEVKGAESLRVDLERKYALFRNQDAKNEDQTVIDKTRSTIKALQTRMVVAIEAVDSAAQQLQKLRDEELYPQLLELLEGMGNMWREMSRCHQAQLRAVEAIRRLDNSAACEPTTSSHRHSTQQLELGLNKWSECLSRAVHSQRDYLKNLTSWLRLSLMQFGDEAPDTRSASRSPSRSPGTPLSNTASSPIYGLCSKWLDSLDQLADRVVLEAIGSFAAVVREMLRLQWEELRIKKRVETYHRELEKREQALANAAMRDPGALPHPIPQTPSTTSGSDMDDRSYDSRYDGRYEGRYDIVPHREGYSERTEVAEKRNKMEATRRKLEDEIQAERKAYTDTRAYTLNSLQAGLPQLFQAVLAFCNQESDVYEKLNGAGTPLRGRH